MGIQTRVICDVCGKDISPLENYVKLKPDYFCENEESGSRYFYKEDFDWYICRRCLNEIGKRVAEQNVSVDFEISESCEGEQ